VQGDEQRHRCSLSEGKRTMQANIRITLIYLAICHLLLTATSPAYKHQLKRFEAVCSSKVAMLSEYAAEGRYIQSYIVLWIQQRGYTRQSP
jgi:hypothetical protein